MPTLLTCCLLNEPRLQFFDPKKLLAVNRNESSDDSLSGFNWPLNLHLDINSLISLARKLPAFNFATLFIWFKLNFQILQSASILCHSSYEFLNVTENEYLCRSFTIPKEMQSAYSRSCRQSTTKYKDSDTRQIKENNSIPSYFHDLVISYLKPYSCVQSKDYC